MQDIIEFNISTTTLMAITTGVLLAAIPPCQTLAKYMKGRIVDDITALNDLKLIGNARHRKIRGTAVVCGGR